MEPVTIECEHGHTWATKAGSIRRGHWCPACDKIAKSEQMKEFRRKQKEEKLKSLT